MNWEAIGAVGEVGGAIGVIVTLIYLAGQLRQNTKALRSSSYEHWNEISSSFTDYMARYAEELSEIEAHASLESLTAAQLRILSALGIKSIDQAQTAFLHHRAGTLDDDVFESRINAYCRFLDGNPLMKQIWPYELRMYPIPAFAALIEDRVSDLKVTPSSGNSTHSAAE